MVRRPLRLCAAIALVAAAPLHAQHPAVVDMLAAVSMDSVTTCLQELTGEVPVDVGNGPVTITSRNKNAPGNAIAADYLVRRLSSWGYGPVVQAFGPSGENILAVKPGLVHPGRKVIISGHYDSEPGGPVAAPGADDDGSGTVAVLEAARVFAGMSFDHTVVFAFWDEEEQGMVGSAFYAGAAAAQDDTIAAVVNMDAIGWDGNGDDLMRIHARAVANSLAIKDTALMVNTAYALGAHITVNNPGALYSDHAPFWAEGYGAVLMIEDFDNDPNPRYHTSNDRVQFLDMPYFGKLLRVSLATAAHMAVPVGGGTGMAPAQALPAERLRVWPVPTEGRVRIRADGPGGATRAVALTDLSGRPVRTLHEGASAPGPLTLDADLHDLPAGTYLVRAVDERGGAMTAPLVLVR